MLCIRVRYLPATNKKPSRFVATDGRNTMTTSYQFENEEKEKLALAQAFRSKFLPLAPELQTEPFTFKGDCFYGFVPKADAKKLV